MAWFLNIYHCERCRRVWTDEWSCMCDDQCPHCGFRDMSPVKSKDLTELILPDGKEFIVLRSPDSAEHDPDYEEIGRFPTQAKAQEFLASHDRGE